MTSRRTLALPWPEERLDTVLETLCPAHESSTEELAQLWNRIGDAYAHEIGVRVGLTHARPLRAGRRHRRAAVASVLAATCVLGTVGVAAAAGVFTQQARKAFVPGPDELQFRVDPASAALRASTVTPDGGHAELWTATGRDSCAAILLDDPGVTPPDKPYRPGSGCVTNTSTTQGMEVGRGYQSRAGQQFLIRGGAVDPSAVVVLLTSVQGDSVTAPAHGGYYIVVIPEPSGQAFNGISYRDGDGRTTVVSAPYCQGRVPAAV